MLALFDILDMDRDGEISHGDFEVFCDTYGEEVSQGTLLELMNDSVFIRRYPDLVCTLVDFVPMIKLSASGLIRFKFSPIGRDLIDIMISRCDYFDPISIDEFITYHDNGSVSALNFILPALFDSYDYVSISSMNRVTEFI